VRFRFIKNCTDYSSKAGDFVYKITVPEKNEELAEFLGVCFGDGCISISDKKKDYQVCIAGHLRLDDDYLRNHVNALIKSLFSIEPKFRIQGRSNTLLLSVRSKELAHFLNSIGMPIGRKSKSQMRVPDWIRANMTLMKSFTRGLFDTDGTFNFRLGKYPRVSIAMANREPIVDVHDFLVRHGFSLGKIVEERRTLNGSEKEFVLFKLFLNGHKNFKRWMKEIGSSNPKHLNRMYPLGRI